MIIEQDPSHTNALNYIKRRRSNLINGIPTNFKAFKKILPAWDVNTTTILAASQGVGEKN